AHRGAGARVGAGRVRGCRAGGRARGGVDPALPAGGPCAGTLTGAGVVATRASQRGARGLGCAAPARNLAFGQQLRGGEALPPPVLRLPLPGCRAAPAARAGGGGDHALRRAPGERLPGDRPAPRLVGSPHRCRRGRPMTRLRFWAGAAALGVLLVASWLYAPLAAWDVLPA